MVQFLKTFGTAFRLVRQLLVPIALCFCAAIFGRFLSPYVVEDYPWGQAGLIENMVSLPIDIWITFSMFRLLAPQLTDALGQRVFHSFPSSRFALTYLLISAAVLFSSYQISIWVVLPLIESLAGRTGLLLTLFGAASVAPVALVLAALGTALPAAASTDHQPIFAAVMRTKRAFFPLFLQLIISVGVVMSFLDAINGLGQFRYGILHFGPGATTIGSFLLSLFHDFMEWWMVAIGVILIDRVYRSFHDENAPSTVARIFD